MPFTVVIDYRNDPKASTGHFEMIYRQVIPPAPAYLGLNLHLKGTQLVPKNGGGKREKPKSDVKSKIERKNSQHYVKPVRDLINGDSEKTPILSPRSLLIDFNECNENNNPILNSARKSMQSITALSRSNKENVLKNDKTLSVRRNSYLSLNRFNSKHNEVKEIPLSTRKSVGKASDSTRRHASCGPKLVSISPPDENKIEVTEEVEDDRSKIKCVGNKCGPEIEVNDSTADCSTKTSPRKSAQETPRITITRTKLKPINTLSKSARAMMPNPKDKPMTNSSEYRKYMTQSSLHLSKMPSKLPIHSNYYNSHFYAVGLSLRALKSNYGRHKADATPSTTMNSKPLERKNL